MDAGASYVNAGYISPSHIIPLAAPGVVKQGLKWMFDPSSPLYIKPRLDFDFLKWALAFNKSCSAKNVSNSAAVIRDISLRSELLYKEIREKPEFDFHMEKKGILMICQTEAMLEEEMEVAELGRKLGLEVNDLDAKALQALEHEVELDAVGATHFLCDTHTTPGEFMSAMKTYLRDQGVEILKNTGVETLDLAGKTVKRIRTGKGDFEADEVVIAAGSWTPQLCKKIGIPLLVQAGKGYRINCLQKTGIQYPAILTEAKAAVTPMNGFTRFAGTMEIAGISDKINKVRVEAIAAAAKRYYPQVELSAEEKKEASSGLRPVSPDGLPFIGRPNGFNNLSIATGHAMMGWTMATGTGKLISELIGGKTPFMPLEPFAVNRRF